MPGTEMLARVQLAALAAAGAVLAAVAPIEDARADFIDHFATGDDVGKMKVPRDGDASILVIPLIVDDQPVPRSFEQDLAAFFAPDAPAPSFSAYYRATSRDRYRPAPILAPAVHIPSCPMLGSYADCKIPRGGGLAEGDISGAVNLLRDSLRLIADVITCADEGPSPSTLCTSGGGADLRAIDRSGPAGRPDGWADGVLIVSNSGFPGIALPVKWLAEHPLLRIGAAPLPALEYDGITIGAVGIASGDSGYVAGSIATHEFGHLLGFADLYNEQGTTVDLPYSSMGGWYYEPPPPLLDPFSRAAIGWADVQQIAGPATIELPPVAHGGPVLKLGTGDEIFLVEYRTRTGWVDGDLGVAGGVVVQRVRLPKLPMATEGRFIGTLTRCVNCVRWDPLTLIEQADGRHDLQMMSGGRDDAQDLFLEGDKIEPSADTAPRNDQHLVFSTNKLSGHPTGVRVEVLAIEPDKAVLAVDAPPLVDGCADMQRYCGPRSCQTDFCGEPPAPPSPDAGVSADAGAQLGSDAAMSSADGGAGGPDRGVAPRVEDSEQVEPGSGCSCRASADPTSRAALLVFLVFVLIRRRRA